MNERLQRARRMVTWCKQFHNLTKWKLLDCSNKQAAYNSKQLELLSFFERDTAFAGRFAVIAMRKLKNISEMTVSLAKEKEILEGKVLHAGRLVQLSEKFFLKLDLESHFEQERKDLTELIDVSLISSE